MAVSCESITASVPSRIALATSATSARVGREAVTIESSIWVAVIDGRAMVPASARSFFWTIGTSWIGSSMPRSPRATMTQSAALRIASARSTACGFSIFAMSGSRVWRRTASTSSTPAHEGQRDEVDADALPRVQHSPGRPSGTDGRISVSPGMFSPCREATAPPNSTSQSNSWHRAHGGDAQADRAVGQVHDLAGIDRVGQLGIATEICRASPSPSSWQTKVTVLPVSSSTRSSTSWPMRILGPGRSWRIATGRPAAFAASRTMREVSACSSTLPWEKFRRATSMPASIMRRRVSGSRDAGPMVATIFVRRMSGNVLARCRAYAGPSGPTPGRAPRPPRR